MCDIWSVYVDLRRCNATLDAQRPANGALAQVDVEKEQSKDRVKLI